MIKIPDDKSDKKSHPYCDHYNKIEVLHISVKPNVSEIFTKELRNGDHFRELRNLFMRPRRRI